MIKRTDLPEEEKRRIAARHKKRIKIFMTSFVVSVLVLLIAVCSFGKRSDSIIQACITGGGILMFLSILILSAENHCPFCGLKMDTRMGNRSPLYVNYPDVCPLCGERLKY